MLDDSALLQRFALARAEEDFAELVQRHLNLVYSAALRQVGGDHQFAEEVTQSVFADLARKAGSLGNHASLAGWLYTSAHYAAAKLVRGEQRRRLREKEACQMQHTHTNPAAEFDWEQLQPVIDEAMHALPEADREVILQRYFQRMPFLQIGARHGLTENAARMRAERALDKLRGILAARGVSATAMALGAGLMAQAVLAPPTALAAAIVSTSLTAGALTGVEAGGGLVTAAKLKVLIPSACAVALLFGVVWQQSRLNQLREENVALRQTQVPVEVEASTTKLAGAADKLQKEKLELLRLRGEVGRLRRDLAERQNQVARMVATNGQSARTQQPAEAQVNVKARFVTGVDEALDFFADNSTGIIGAAEMNKLLAHLKEADTVELLAEQQVTTLSGRQAQVQSLEFRTNSITGVVTESGHVVDVLPMVQDGGESVKLTVIASKYDGKPVVTNEWDTAASLPVIKMNQLTANAAVWNGQTLAMTRQSDGKKLVVFVTATIVDQAGNRVRLETEP